MNKIVKVDLPKVDVKVIVIPKNKATYTWHSEEIKGIGALETHRDYLIPELASYVHKELKRAIYAHGATATKVEINDSRKSSRRYINEPRKLVVDIHEAIVTEIRKAGTGYD